MMQDPVEHLVADIATMDLDALRTFWGSVTALPQLSARFPSCK